ncbi:MAG: T9SS type A sorting domain-containing protein [Bacteroidetes bacterium]|nr:T9SS type A sorting domain-containing protein [Bacteroidota bacterium]MBU1113586.1 T9SS type A sorting domain-containing protein [Bacteroidota bacterium]MBU1796962.1 T9SS type A sorting domain-containing protein [Bacteroidota bacterium]
MKKSAILFFAFMLCMAYSLSAQVYIDPTLEIEAKALNYKMDAAPTIDGDGSEWASIPWQTLYFNDKDFNGDNLSDPFPGRIDYVSKFKAGWVDGSNVLYLLINIQDDQFITADSINWYNSDGLEIRVDPFDQEAAGEPGENPSSAFNIGFRVGINEASGVEGTAPSGYEAKWVVNENSFPKTAQLEVAITLDATATLQNLYNMGFYLYCSDNDINQDDSQKDKDAATVIWPQLYNGLNGERIGVDAVWSNTYFWGNLECVSQTVHNVSGSIQASLDAASEGDIVVIPAGQYTENITISTPNIIVMADGDVSITPAVASEPVITIANDDAAYGVTIKNITLEGINNDSTNAAAGIVIGSASARILGNTFNGFDSPILKGSVDSTKAFACVFEDNKSYLGNGGISFNTSGTVIRYNYSEEQQGSYAINVKGTQPGTAIDIAYNTIFNHRGECGIGYGGSATFTIHHNMNIRSESLYGAGDTSGDDGFENQDKGGSTDYIYNNTIVGWKSDGMQMGNGESNFYVRNNLIAHCSGKDYDIRTVASTDIDYGLSFANGTNNIATLGTVAIVEDPLFTNELEDDFTITDGSPAVDAGQIEPFGFKVRFVGNAPDIGAFETGTPVTDVDSKNLGEIPSNYSLSQNYPNPFNPTTTINFSLPETGIVTLKIFNVLGQEVATLVNGNLGIGNHQINFDASKLSSGVYMYTIQAGDFTATKKMMLMK